MSEIYMVTGCALQHHYIRGVAQKGEARWNVRACASREGAEALAQRLNSWCEVHAVDASISGEARRALLREKADAVRDEFNDEWWREHVDAVTPWYFSEGSETDIANIAAMDQAWALVKPPTPEIGVPPEDPAFTTSWEGTKYSVEAMTIDS